MRHRSPPQPAGGRSSVPVRARLLLNQSSSAHPAPEQNLDAIGWPMVSARRMAGCLPEIRAVRLAGRFCLFAVSSSMRPAHRSAATNSLAGRVGLNSPARVGRVTRDAIRVDGGSGPMPQEARERLERALCGVLERRYPGLRFTMKGEVDARRQRAAPLSDAHGLKHGA